MTDPQWIRQVQHLQDIVDGLTLAEIEVLDWLVEKRKRVLYPPKANVMPTVGLSGPLLEFARWATEDGIRTFRAGRPGFEAFATIASASDTAKRNTDFQRFLGAVVDRAGNPPTRGTP